MNLDNVEISAKIQDDIAYRIRGWKDRTYNPETFDEQYEKELKASKEFYVQTFLRVLINSFEGHKLITKQNDIKVERIMIIEINGVTILAGLIHINGQPYITNFTSGASHIIIEPIQTKFFDFDKYELGHLFNSFASAEAYTKEVVKPTAKDYISKQTLDSFGGLLDIV
jgi:hypothetical protein